MTIFRHQAIGTLPDGETFEFGIHSSKVLGDIGDAHTAWQTALNDLWSGTSPPDDSIEQLFPSSISVIEVVTTQLDPVTGKGVLQERNGVLFEGSGSGGALPQEVAVRVTTTDGTPSHSGRGGFNLPSPVLTACVGSRLASTPQSQISEAATLMLRDMDTAGFPAGIYHPGTKTITTITGCKVGDVFDSMRTRRNKLREVYVSTSI